METALGKKAVYFFHIPKTGGRTLTRSLAQFFGSDRIVHVPKNKGLLTDILRTSKSRKSLARGGGIGKDIGSLGEKDALPHVMGHFASFSLIAERSDCYYKICFWRHPADWTLSLYNFRHYRNRHKLRRRFAFGDFRRSMLSNPMTEHLLLYCADVPGYRYFLMSDRAKFDAACRIVEKFDRFADIEQVDNVLEALRPTETSQIQHHNRLSKSSRTINALSDRTRRKLEMRNRIDYLLWLIARGEDMATVKLQADTLLARTRKMRELGLLLRLPWYRFKVWVLPFLGAEGTRPAGQSSENRREPLPGEPPQ